MASTRISNNVKLDPPSESFKKQTLNSFSPKQKKDVAKQTLSNQNILSKTAEKTISTLQHAHADATKVYEDIQEPGGLFLDKQNQNDELIKSARKQLLQDIQGYFSSLKVIESSKNTIEAIQNSSVYKVTSTNSAKYIKAILDSKLFKLLTSRLVIRATAAIIIMATSGPLLTAIGLGFIGVSTVVDTVVLAKTRKLKHEHSKLLQHLNAREEQKFKLNAIAPNLKRILSGDLIPFEEQNALSSKNHKLAKINSSLPSSLGKAFLKNVKSLTIGCLKLITTPSAFNMASIALNAASLGSSVLFFLMEFRQQRSISKFNNNLRLGINKLKTNPECPIYKDRMDLDEQVRALKIQNLAIEKMIWDPRVMKLEGSLRRPDLSANEQIEIENKIRNYFQQNLEEVNKRVKIIKNSRGLIANLRQAGKNFVESLNPFGKYNDLKEVEKSLSAPSKIVKLHERCKTHNEALTTQQSNQKHIKHSKEQEVSVIKKPSHVDQLKAKTKTTNHSRS